jgi:hypothetical protein
MLLFACDPPQVTIDISSTPALLEEVHGIAHFQDLSQDHTVYNTKQDFSMRRQMKVNPKINIFVSFSRHVPLTCKSLTKVDLA